MGLPGTDLQRPPNQIPLVKANLKEAGRLKQPSRFFYLPLYKLHKKRTSSKKLEVLLYCN